MSELSNTQEPHDGGSDQRQRLVGLEQRITELNWKLSMHVDAGGGIMALEKWVDCILKDSSNKTKMLRGAGLLPNH